MLTAAILHDGGAHKITNLLLCVKKSRRFLLNGIVQISVVTILGAFLGRCFSRWSQLKGMFCWQVDATTTSISLDDKITDLIFI